MASYKKNTIVTDNSFEKAWKNLCKCTINLKLFFRSTCHECWLKTYNNKL